MLSPTGCFRITTQDDVSPNPNIFIEFRHALDSVSDHTRRQLEDHLRFHNFFHGDTFHAGHNVGDPWDLTGLVPALDHRVGTPFLFLDSFW
jgi:hypothetical protein